MIELSRTCNHLDTNCTEKETAAQGTLICFQAGDISRPVVQAPGSGFSLDMSTPAVQAEC